MILANTSETAIEMINGIKFTPGEIHIISCIISGRSTKSISTLLNISAKTTEGHIRSIMTKFGRNSRDIIARAVEKSNEDPLLVQHYYKICNNKIFEDLFYNYTVLNLPKCRLMRDSLL